MYTSGVDSGSAGGARAPLEFGGSEKGQSLISAHQSLAITLTASTSGFENLSMALYTTSGLSNLWKKRKKKSHKGLKPSRCNTLVDYLHLLGQVLNIA